jgi:hypothetical protein
VRFGQALQWHLFDPQRAIVVGDPGGAWEHMQ